MQFDSSYDRSKFTREDAIGTQKNGEDAIGAVGLGYTALPHEVLLVQPSSAPCTVTADGIDQDNRSHDDTAVVRGSILPSAVCSVIGSGMDCENSVQSKLLESNNILPSNLEFDDNTASSETLGMIGSGMECRQPLQNELLATNNILPAESRSTAFRDHTASGITRDEDVLDGDETPRASETSF